MTTKEMTTNSEINLNGNIYVLKSELDEIKSKLDNLLKGEKKKALRFDEKKYTKLVKLFSGIFTMERESISEDFVLDKEFCIIDPANILLVSPKSEEAKRLLVIFKSFDSEEKAFPEIDFKPDYNLLPDKEQVEIQIQKAKFSQEYLRKILEILNVTDDGVYLTVKKDMPIIAENNHFKFILAPRVESSTKSGE